jgi:hypothetical protein
MKYYSLNECKEISSELVRLSDARKIPCAKCNRILVEKAPDEFYYIAAGLFKETGKHYLCL